MRPEIKSVHTANSDIVKIMSGGYCYGKNHTSGRNTH